MTTQAVQRNGSIVPAWARDNAILLALVPALVFFAVVFVYPNLRFVIEGLFAEHPNGPSLLDILSGRSMLVRLTLMSVSLGICTALGTLIFGYPIAYYLARSTSRWRHYVFVVIFVPLLFSIVIRTFGWIVLLGSNGLLNGLLVQLGAIDQPIVWLYNFPMTVIGLVHVFLPFMVLSVLSSLTRVDQRIEDAAAILGAGPWRTFRHVTLPAVLAGNLRRLRDRVQPDGRCLCHAAPAWRRPRAGAGDRNLHADARDRRLGNGGAARRIPHHRHAAGYRDLSTVRRRIGPPQAMRQCKSGFSSDHAPLTGTRSVVTQNGRHEQ